uniref:Uncharacterized protein n=1 Tax=Vespula pensylvanica TaxID=30213 RepID=A0A834PGQ7_VESPE|nr:hypothetical protein H0235_001749 [Vespula pensylvanica]
MILIGTPGRRAEEETAPKWVRNGWSLVGVRSRAETEGVAVAGELLRNNYPTAAMFLEETLFHWLLLGSFHTCSLPSIEAGQRCCTVQALCCKLFLVAAFVSIPFFAVLREWRAVAGPLLRARRVVLHSIALTERRHDLFVDRTSSAAGNNEKRDGVNDVNKMVTSRYNAPDPFIYYY